MPRRPLSDAEIASTRSQIRAAAARILARDGYQGLSLRAIGREMGCSAATPYSYYANKEEIVAALRTEAFEAFAEALENAGVGVDKPVERVRAVACAYLVFALEDPGRYHLMFEFDQAEGGEFPALREARARSFACPLAATTLAVEQGAMAGDPSALAHIIWGACHGVVALHLAHQLDMGWDLEKLVEPLVDVLFASATPRIRKAPRKAALRRKRRG